ncbi:MAG TPA: rod shape-determining protein MreD [Anaerolineae bacterium]|nr:rod shape-determining protein MreD [Anaerolineae bacterium]
MATLIAIPIMLIVSVLQMASISRLPLLNGNADLILLTILSWGLNEKAKNVYFWAAIAGLLVSFISALPFPVPVLIYLIVAWISRQVHGRIWQSPILAMLIVTFFSTLMQHVITIIFLQVTDVPVYFLVSMKEVTVPSLVFNLLLAVPLYLVVSNLSRWVYQEGDYE